VIALIINAGLSCLTSCSAGGLITGHWNEVDGELFQELIHLRVSSDEAKEANEEEEITEFHVCIN